jgi:hypothetical protein
MATITAATTMRGGRWCRCNDVTISHDEVKSHEWQQRLHWQTRGCSGSCVGDGSEHNGNEGDEESEGVEGDEGEGNEGDNGNFPKGGGRRWTQQSTRY